MGSFPRGAIGFARVDPRNPVAFAICDRCGQRYNHSDLTWQYEWAGAQLQNRRILVCRRKCLDEPNEQLRAYSLPPDPLPVRNPRPESADMVSSFTPYLTDENGNLITDEFGHPIVVSNGPAYFGDFDTLPAPGSAISIWDGGASTWDGGLSTWDTEVTGRVLRVLNVYGWPQTSANLPPGYVWRDSSNVVHVVPGVVPVPSQPLFLNVASSAQMLLFGGGNLPLADPLVNNQFWNNQGMVYVSGSGP